MNTASIKELQTMGGELRHYAPIDRAVQPLPTALLFLASKQGTVRDHSEIIGAATDAYEQLNQGLR